MKVTPTLALLGLMAPVAPVPVAPVLVAQSWGEAPALPFPIANNAVAAVRTPDGSALFSFLGIDSTRAWNGRLAVALRWDVGSAEWRRVRKVPGEGRLAATAQTARGKIYLFGGYTVADDGSEQSLPNVDIYDPETDRWSAGARMPMPVDDAVSGVWRDSLIYLVSGWHDRGNVAAVQIYDPAADRWMAATPIPGPPVFGHAGGVVGNTIVYIDGTRTLPEGRPRFRIEGSAWAGDIDPTRPERIRWRRLPPHPGPPLYRAAAAGVADRWVLFAGGTDNPYNYDGVGYDGAPSEPRAGAFAWDTLDGRWLSLPSLPVATMDHRGIAIAGSELFVVGGMGSGQRVTRRVARAHLGDLLSTEPEPGGDAQSTRRVVQPLQGYRAPALTGVAGVGATETGTTDLQLQHATPTGIEVTDFDRVQTLAQRDRPESFGRRVAPIVIHHDLAADREPAAVVGCEPEGVDPIRRSPQVAAESKT